jgi:hypothetical protein
VEDGVGDQRAVAPGRRVGPGQRDVLLGEVE